jgi:hypothetical protein
MADTKKTPWLHWRILCLLLPLLLLTPIHGDGRSQPKIILHSPGEGAVVTSPIPIQAQITPGDSGLVRLTLVDADNNLLSRQVFPIDKAVSLDLQLAFEIPGTSTAARLVLSLYDAYQRPESIRSVDLILQTGGQAEIRTQPDAPSWLILEQPLPLKHIEGGVVSVQGSINPPNSNPVIFELITETGGVIGTTLLSVPEGPQPFDFELEIPYKFIHQTRRVRLVVRQTGQTIPGDVILDSLEIILSP